jgi:hypothetical protein
MIMKYRAFIIGIALWLLLGLSVSSAFAQAGGGYQFTQTVTATGAKAAGGTFSVEYTVGQPIAGGSVAGSSYRVYPGFWTPPDFAPTAAGVDVSGRVIRSNGQGIRNAVVTLIDPSGSIRTTLTASFGYFIFEDVPAAGTYVLTITSKRFAFTDPTRVLNLIGDLIDVDFIAEN